MDNFLDNLLAEALAPRVIRLVHRDKEGKETVLGNFLERPCRAGRTLIPCDSPTCVCEEFVKGEYWLQTYHHRKAAFHYEETEQDRRAIRERFYELINGPDDLPDDDEDEEEDDL